MCTWSSEKWRKKHQWKKWRLKVKIWRPKFLDQLPIGALLKMLISSPAVLPIFHNMSHNLPCCGMQNSKINTQVIWKSNSIIKPFYSAFHNSIECVVPENIHTPTTEDHWKFWRGGRVKGQQFPRGRGVSWETTFPKGHEPRTKHESNIQSIWSTKTYLHTFF